MIELILVDSTFPLISKIMQKLLHLLVRIMPHGHNFSAGKGH